MQHLASVQGFLSELATTRERGNGLAGIKQLVRVERVLDRVETLELGGRELDTHRRELLYADAVLAGNRAPNLDAQPEDAIAEFDCLFGLPRLVGVEQDQRVQVSRARVEHLGTGKAKFLQPERDFPQDALQHRAGDRAVDAIVT